MSKIYVFEEPMIRAIDNTGPKVSLNAALDEHRHLVIIMSYDDVNNESNPYYGFDKSLIVTKKGTELLTRKLNADMAGLAGAFCLQFNGARVDSWSLDEVFEVFNEIRNYLECLNIHFRVKTEYKLR